MPTTRDASRRLSDDVLEARRRPRAPGSRPQLPRSYEIKNGEKANADEKPGQNEVFEGPGGVVYVTANSASGSKYYDLTTPVAGDATSGAGNGADP
jgi:hypothetical protein